jgi:hypothetical protein
MNSSETLYKVWHVDEQSLKLVHSRVSGVEDLFDCIYPGFECPNRVRTADLLEPTVYPATVGQSTRAASGDPSVF